MNGCLQASDGSAGPGAEAYHPISRAWTVLHLVAALGMQVLSFWPVWRWYGLRLAEPGEEAWGIAALFAAVWVLCTGGGVCVDGRRSRRGRFGSIGRVDSIGDIGSIGRIGWPPVIATCAYAAAFPFLSPLPRAGLALIALACLLPFLGVRRSAAAHATGFLFLSLPIMPSLQFYLGYPLRVVSGEAAARLLNLAGFPVVREGALLDWGGHAVFIDAPCSGVKMLWAGMMLAMVLSALRGQGLLRMLGQVAIAFGAVVAGNILRTMTLFFFETGVVRGPAWAHTAVGIGAFLAVAGLIAWQCGAQIRCEPDAGGAPCAV